MLERTAENSSSVEGEVILCLNLINDIHWSDKRKKIRNLATENADMTSMRKCAEKQISRSTEIKAVGPIATLGPKPRGIIFVCPISIIILLLMNGISIIKAFA